MINIKRRIRAAQRLLSNSIPDPIDPGDGGGYINGGGYTGGGDPTPPSGGGAGAAAANPALITSSGGLVGFESILLIPLYDPEFKLYTIGTFDYQDFNCEEDCTYFYRQEIISAGRQITVSRIRIIYRDLGICKVTATVSTAQGSNSKEIEIGSAAGTGKLITAFFDFVITGERPQLQIFRAANNGPLSITEASMITDVEVVEQV